MNCALTSFDWTAERVARLKVMAFDGHSAGQIARELGCGRSAVCGKAHRLGLPLRSGSAGGKSQASRISGRDGHRKAKARVKTAKGQNIRRRAPGRGWVRLAKEGSVKLPVPPPDAVPNTAVSLADLEPHHCRWVHGDTQGHHAFCGKAKAPGMSYCMDHARVAYRLPATDVERDEARRKFEARMVKEFA